MLSAVDIAGFTDDSAWRIGGSDEAGFDFTTVQQWSQAVEWLDPVTGDFDGDGTTDVAARTQFGEWWVGLNDGAGGLTTSLWTQWDPSRFWVEALVGDFDGDGDDDIAGLTKEILVHPEIPDSGLALQDWWVALSDGADGFENRLWTTWSPHWNWHEIGVGDFNGDGRDDIGAFEGSVRSFSFPLTRNWWVATSDGSRFTSAVWAQWSIFPSQQADWQDLSFGDFNGDGRDDVAGRYPTGQWWIGVAQAGGGFANQAWTGWDESQDWRDVVVGDFNGDGRDDLAGRSKLGQWWVASSTGTGFVNGLWETWDESQQWAYVVVGDFNDDGRDDLAARRLPAEDPLAIQVFTLQDWWVARSTGLAFASELWATEPFTLYEQVFAGAFDGERD